MTSAFANAFDDGLDDIYEAFGEPSVYTDKRGRQADITIMVDRNLEQYGDAANVAGMTAVLSLRIADTNGRPRKGDTFHLINAPCTEFQVYTPLESNEFEHRCLVA